MPTHPNVSSSRDVGSRPLDGARRLLAPQSAHGLCRFVRTLPGYLDTRHTRHPERMLLRGGVYQFILPEQHTTTNTSGVPPKRNLDYTSQRRRKKTPTRSDTSKGRWRPRMGEGPALTCGPQWRGQPHPKAPERCFKGVSGRPAECPKMRGGVSGVIRTSLEDSWHSNRQPSQS